MILDLNVTVVCCTPTYALRLAEVAAQEKIAIGRSRVRTLLVAGEPGGSIPETRRRIEQAWRAREFDHTGMTEIGPLGFECFESPGGVHLLESECIAEVIDPQSQKPLPDGQVGELAITNGSGSITKNGINVPADRAAAILSSRAGHYFNVHTALNPDGAIRGQLAGGGATLHPGTPVAY